MEALTFVSTGYKVPVHQVTIRAYETLAELRAAGFRAQKVDQTVREISYLEKVLQVHQAAKELNLPEDQWFTQERTCEYYTGLIGRPINCKLAKKI